MDLQGPQVRACEWIRIGTFRSAASCTARSHALAHSIRGPFSTSTFLFGESDGLASSARAAVASAIEKRAARAATRAVRMSGDLRRNPKIVGRAPFRESRRVRVLALSSSLRPGNRTSVVCGLVADGLEKAGHEVDRLELASVTMEFCDARPLEQYGPSMREAAERIAKADGYVIAMPVYCYS